MHQRKFIKSYLNIKNRIKKFKVFFKTGFMQYKIKIFKKLHLRNYLNDHISLI